MEKTLSLGAFEELSENEVMVTEGGLGFIALGVVIVACGVLLTGCGAGDNGGEKGLYPDPDKYKDYRC